LIERYSNKEIKALFNEKSRFIIQTKIEYYILKYLTPESMHNDLYDAFQNIDYNKLIEDIKEREKVTKHETVALVNSIIKHIPEKFHSYIHKGVTSSDILDTCLNLQIIESHEILSKKINNLLEKLKELAINNKGVKIIGRSHGVRGEITSLGLIFLGYYAEWERNKKRLESVIKEIKVCKMSGAMGNYVHVDPGLEEYISNIFSLKQEKVSTQVIPRDRYANYISTLSLLGGSIERISTYIRLSSQSGINELQEGFSNNQTGSSAMPHKKNPILSENLSGLSRIIKSYSNTSINNIALWYERDMTHSSVERIILPDLFHLLTFSIERLCKILNNIFINYEKINYNLNVNDDYLSQTILIKLMEKGSSREEAYELVQKLSFENVPLESYLYKLNIFDYEEILEILNKEKYIKNEEYIFKKFNF
tara:strand:+ start:1729 stop:2997 length:1269 start_codon:yes stop_codon:yes gene_type:complete